MRAGLPFDFTAGRNEIVFSRQAVDRCLESADPALCSLLMQLGEQRLQSLVPAGSFEGVVAAAMRDLCCGCLPTLGQVARQLGLSNRTLQRRLAETGWSFRELLTQVLRDLSDQLLDERRMRQGEVAFLLGYSEVSAFSRAYRSWAGHAPGTHRRGTTG